MNKLQNISDHEKKLLTGEAVAESPRQIIRDVSSGKILSNGKVEPVSLRKMGLRLALPDKTTTCCTLHITESAYQDKKDPERILFRSPDKLSFSGLWHIYGYRHYQIATLCGFFFVVSGARSGENGVRISSDWAM